MDHSYIHQIVVEVLKGQTEKFEIIVQRYEKPIFLYCYHMLGHRTEAEDSGQEVFLKAYRSLDKFKPDLSLEAWLYKIAYNQCIDVIRKRKLTRYLPFFYRKDQENAHVDLAIEANYFDEYVLKAMSRLSAEERNLLILRCVEDKSYEEISQILQRNSPSLRKKYERTAAKFRTYYALAKGDDPREKGVQQRRSGSEKTFS